MTVSQTYYFLVAEPDHASNANSPTGTELRNITFYIGKDNLILGDESQRNERLPLYFVNNHCRWWAQGEQIVLHTASQRSFCLDLQFFSLSVDLWARLLLNYKNLRRCREFR